MPNPITWWEIYGKDAKKLQKYYAELFNWHVDTSNPMNYGMVDTHDPKGIGGGIAESDQGEQVMIYVEVDDIQAFLDKAVKMGGKVVTPVTVVPDQVTFAQFRDIAGNVMGLIQSEPR
jgi:predicted enzyme related to lactoylglutathione lyase